MLNITLEYEIKHGTERRAIAVYKDSNMVSHIWLKDSDDEYRIFEVTRYLLKRCYG